MKLFFTRHGLGLAVLLLLWAALGLGGRDAWKSDEALLVGQVLDWQSGAWGGVSSPFYVALADGLQRLTVDALPWLDGARLASGLLTLLALWLTARSAALLFGPGAAAMAALALVGCFGLSLRAHALLPEVGLLAGYAVLLYGLLRWPEWPRWGGAVVGLAMAMLLFSRGLPDLIAGGAIVAGVLFLPAWRGALARQGLAWVVGVGLAVSMFAALGLWGGSPAAWLGGLLSLGAGWLPERTPAGVLNLLLWFAWPVWPLAAWAIWHEHRRLVKETALHPLLIALAVLLVLAMWPASSREGGALPVLLPLSLLAVHGLMTLRRGAAQAFYWFGVVGFGFLVWVLWLYFAAIQWGWPAAVARHMARLTPGYAPGSVGLWSIGLAGLATLVWLLALPLFPRARVRPVLVWATGMMLSWILLMVLFRPWAEAGWGYRPMIEAMAGHLPDGACVNAEVDRPMQAMLRLHLGRRYQPGAGCAYLLRRQSGLAEGVGALSGEVLWTGGRPRQRRDVYELRVRRDGAFGLE